MIQHKFNGSKLKKPLLVALLFLGTHPYLLMFLLTIVYSTLVRNSTIILSVLYKNLQLKQLIENSDGTFAYYPDIVAIVKVLESAISEPDHEPDHELPKRIIKRIEKNKLPKTIIKTTKKKKKTIQ